MDKFVFLIIEGFRNVGRHKGTAFVSVVTTTIALVIFGSLLVLNDNSKKLPELFKSKYKVEVFFSQNISNKDGKRLSKKISSREIVKKAAFISKEDALLIYKDEFDENINDILGYNPLPSGCLIYLNEKKFNSKKMDNFVKYLESIEGISSVHYLDKIISKLERIFSFIHGSIKLLVGVVLIISIFFILNTIKLTIYARSEFIKTLSLLGATPLFIKTPFIIEGLLQSVVGALFSYGLLLLLINGINNILSDWVSVQLTIAFFLPVWLMVISIIIGFIGSYKALSKFL